jgi:hypothetical protein
LSRKARLGSIGFLLTVKGAAPAEAPDVCEVVLSSLSVRWPREFGACWLGSRLWQELKLDQFFAEALRDRRGSIEWARVLELLAHL